MNVKVSVMEKNQTKLGPTTYETIPEFATVASEDVRGP